MTEHNIWDKHLIKMCYLVAEKSKDPSTKTGSVIVDEDNVILATGYNGFPRGVDDAPERYEDRSIKYKMVAHAEENAIFHAARKGHSVKGARIYVPWHPCAHCAIAIIQSGIREVVMDGNFEDDPELMKRWADDHHWATTMFNEAGVIVRKTEKKV